MKKPYIELNVHNRLRKRMEKVGAEKFMREIREQGVNEDDKDSEYLGSARSPVKYTEGQPT